MKEIEVKILEIDPEKNIQKLESLGAEKTLDSELSAEFFRNEKKEKIRLRKFKNLIGEEKFIINFKKRDTSDLAMQNEEFETEFTDYDAMKHILLGAGLELYGTSKKHRISYKLEDIVFDIDKYEGIPYCMEIESFSLENVVRWVELLGYTMNDTLLLTERALKEKYWVR